MKLDRAERIAEILSDNGEEADVRETYSGRGMYGKETAAVVSDSLTSIIYAAGFADGEDDGDWDDNLRYDQMGLGYVVY